MGKRKKAKSTNFSLKDELFNEERVTYLGNLFFTADSAFDMQGFVQATMKGFAALELKERIVHIAATLESVLDADFRVAAKQISAALPPPLDPTKSDDDFGDFIFAPLGEFVVRNGLAKKHVKLSLKTLKQITMRFSMEDAIRAFINTHPEVTLRELEKWSTDKNYHVRRLVSEGTRPLLPWSKRLRIDAKTPLPLLDTLHTDSTRYVTRSVANHLNDIAKTDPQRVLATLKRWQKWKRQEPAELAWICKHALRTLVKQGDEQALQLLGFEPNPPIEITNFAIKNSTLVPGDAIEFSFDMTAEASGQLMIDYVIEFVKANGELKPKVHKLKQLSVKKGESVAVKKRHILRKNATTYTLYPGTHYVALQVNGKTHGRESFELLEG